MCNIQQHPDLHPLEANSIHTPLVITVSLRWQNDLQMKTTDLETLPCAGVWSAPPDPPIYPEDEGRDRALRVT